MWRFNTVAQPSIFAASEVTVDCAVAPRLVSATAASATSVTLTFDVAMGAVVANDFVIPGLVVSAATGANAVVTLTTANQTAGASYTVTVDPTVESQAGVPIDSAARTATFTGFSQPTGGDLIINEVDYDQLSTDSREFIEIYNPTNATITLDGTQLELYSENALYTSNATYELEGQLGAGDYLVIASTAVLDEIFDGNILELPFSKATDNLQNGGADAIALRRNGVVIAALCYEACPATHIGAPSPAATDGNTAATPSIGRCPSGVTTGDNVVDFKLTTASTPGLPNACPAL